MSSGPRQLDRDGLLAEVTRFYVESRDFNGMPVPGPQREATDLAAMFPALAALQRDVPPPPEFEVGDVVALVRDGLISVNRGEFHPNPHIKAFDPEPIEDQILKIQEWGLAGCLYPEPKHLETVVDRAQYADRPFTLQLALGQPSLSFKVFDLAVLEHYRNDPRYSFDVSDVHGGIGVKEDGSGDSLGERDQVFFQTFGFAYDRDLNRAVAAFLRYLDDLSPEHQRLWESRMLEGDYGLHPDYLASSLGNWPEKVPVLAAFLEELAVINRMSECMGRTPLFRRTYGVEERPREFMFLLRPTLRAFNEFVHLLDKMMSENLNTAFFRDDVALEREVERKDGRVQVERKGSIQVLEQWLAEAVRLKEPDVASEMLGTFRKVRSLRQKPAHAVNEDVFDQQYFHDQRELIVAAYGAVRTLRLILANHPSTADVEISDHLAKGEIRMY